MCVGRVADRVSLAPTRPAPSGAWWPCRYLSSELGNQPITVSTASSGFAPLPEQPPAPSPPPALPPSPPSLPPVPLVAAVGWLTPAGGTLADKATGVAIDGQGDVYAVGQVSEGYQYGVSSYVAAFPLGGPTVSTLAMAGFLAKMDGSSGAVLWTRTIGGNGGTQFQPASAAAVAVGLSGTSYVTGKFVASIACAGLNLTANSSLSDAFVAKYDSSGTCMWAVQLGGTEADGGSGIAADAAGSTYAVGHFEGEASFGGVALSGLGSRQLYVAKLSGAGAVEWAVQSTGVAEVSATAVAVSSSTGFSYVTGQFTGNMMVGGQTMAASAPAGFECGFVASFDAAGVVRWLTDIGEASGAQHTLSLGIAWTPWGHTVLTGQYTGCSKFGNVGLCSSTPALFAAELDDAGDVKWATSPMESSPPGVSTGTGVAADAYGNLYVSGSFGSASSPSQSVGFGGTQFEPSASVAGPSATDGIVLKLDGAGGCVWAGRAAGSTAYNDASSAIALTAGGAPVTAGYRADLSLPSQFADIAVERYEMANTLAMSIDGNFTARRRLVEYTTAEIEVAVTR